MNNSNHTHWLAISWSFGYIFLGSLMIFIVIGAVILYASNMASELSLLDALIVSLLLTVGFPAGLVLLTRPFLLKIIVKPQGIECYSTFFILQADWHDLLNIGYVKKTLSGKTLVVVARGGNLILRQWARPFRNFLKEYPNKLQDVQIFASQFRDYDGHSFETDILVNVAQQTESLR